MGEVRNCQCDIVVTCRFNHYWREMLRRCQCMRQDYLLKLNLGQLSFPTGMYSLYPSSADLLQLLLPLCGQEHKNLKFPSV